MEKNKITILTDDNYATWKFEIKMLLKQKGLYTTITSENFDDYLGKECDIEPEEVQKMDKKEMAKLEKTYRNNNEKACAYIGQSVDKKFYKHIGEGDMAFTVWTNIEGHFASLNTANRLGVKIEFYKAQQGRSETLLSYLDRVIAITDRLNDLGWPTSDIEICIKVLSSLSDEFRPAQLSCLMIPEDKLSTNLLRQQFAMDVKKLKNNTNQEGGEAQANFTRNGQKLCTECGYDNHYASNCRAPEARKLAYKAYCDRERTKPKSNDATRNKKRGGVNQTEAQAHETGISFNTGTEDVSQSHLAGRGDWYLDSGATHHMTHDLSVLTNTEEKPIKVLGSLSTEQNVCSVRGEVKLNENEESRDSSSSFLSLKNVIHVPHLRKNLVSVSKICNAGGKVLFEGKGVSILVNDQEVASATMDDNGLYKLEVEEAGESNQTTLLWHQRMGHISSEKLSKLAEMSEGLPASACSHPIGETCVDCCIGKQIRTKIPAKSAKVRSEKLGDFIHSDVCGPIAPFTMGGSSYFVSFIDDFTRMSWVFTMNEKSEVSSLFLQFRKLIKTQFGAQIRRIHSDRGGEYIAGTLSDFCKKKGIIHTFKLLS
jgi:hypothetical protein